MCLTTASEPANTIYDGSSQHAQHKHILHEGGEEDGVTGVDSLADRYE